MAPVKLKPGFQHHIFLAATATVLVLVVANAIMAMRNTVQKTVYNAYNGYRYRKGMNMGEEKRDKRSEVTSTVRAIL